MPIRESYFSKSLEKGLKVLSLFNRDNPVLTQTEIAKRLGLNMTSTYRYINTLVEMGYLEKEGSSKLIRPSIFCLAFCNNLLRASDHRRLIKALVDEVHARHNITIDVAISVDDDMMRIYHREAADTLTYTLPDFTRNCLHNTALGKAVLSTLPVDELRRRVIDVNLSARTAQTITSHDRLLEELFEAKRKGYAVNNEEYLPGLIAIAAPLVHPATGRGVGGVSFDFSVLQRGLIDIETQYASVLLQLAERLSAAIPLDSQHPV